MTPERLKPRGVGLIEMTISAILFAATVTVAMQAVAWVSLERLASQRRSRALREAENLIERLSMIEYDRLDDRAAAAERISPEATAFLPGAILAVKVVTDAPGKLITVELRWKNRTGSTDAPVRLASWVYPRGKRP